MDAQLQKALADIVTALQASAQSVGAAAHEQLPLLVQEYLKWGAFEASRWLTFQAWGAVIIFAILAMAWAIVCRNGFDIDDEAEGALVFASVVGWALIIGFAFSGYNNYMVLKQIELAPRVYLVEKIQEIVK